MEQALSVGGSSRLTPFAGVCVLACMFGRNLLHLHRPTSNEREDDINGEFWERHRRLDNMLLNLALALPEDMRLPAGINNPNVVFMTMKIHTSVICLHQAAIFKADKNRMPAHIAQESKIRCVTAASEIAGIMRLIAHMDTSLVRFPKTKANGGALTFHTDEPVHFFLCLRGGAGLRTVPEKPPWRRTNEQSPPVPPPNDASTQEKESVD